MVTLVNAKLGMPAGPGSTEIGCTFITAGDVTASLVGVEELPPPPPELPPPPPHPAAPSRGPSRAKTNHWRMLCSSFYFFDGNPLRHQLWHIGSPNKCAHVPARLENESLLVDLNGSVSSVLYVGGSILLEVAAENLPEVRKHGTPPSNPKHIAFG